MAVFGVHEAKTHLSKLIERAKAGEEIVIAKGKTPAVRLVPVAQKAQGRRPGTLKGQFEVTEAFFEPLSDEELKAWDQ